MTTPTLPRHPRHIVRSGRETDFRSSRKWRTLRLRILERDRWTCHWCGGPATVADHVVAVIDGGAKWDETNIVAACVPCNNGRPDSGHPQNRTGRSVAPARSRGMVAARGRSVFSQGRGDGDALLRNPHTQRAPVLVTRVYTRSR